MISFLKATLNGDANVQKENGKTKLNYLNNWEADKTSKINLNT